ncbi:autotransporter outer membrane beta-barrel domain-containing protein [Stenotrophomonas cyclobalanopsidis]|uniref:autotransporter outer membrane beta-barrel domain-containing protein n=1 Tax=Stenotrophomonas cyclobalanopsidis TaxID=2771362 RepID=UPI0028AFA08A|nr:autotransporter outer membrane beta-barrel domain-containing protein [Stenotrophomonas cyclobalanopsidis]
MRSSTLARTPLALLISTCLLAPAPAFADDTSDSCKDSDQVHCDADTGISGWWWGGLAALGLGAAAAGGGSSGGGDGGGNGGGGTLPPGQEGGQFGNNQVLSAAGTQVNWQQPVTTRISGRARNEGQLQLLAGTLHLVGEGELRNTGSLTVGSASSLRIDGDADLYNHGALRVEGALQLAGDGSLENFNRADFIGARVQASGEAGIDNHGALHVQGGQWSFTHDSDLENGRNGVLDISGTSIALRDRAEVENEGRILARDLAVGSALFDAVTGAWGNDREAIEALDNRGHIQLDGAHGSALRLVADSHASHAVNRSGASIQSSARNSALLHAEGAQATVLNQGTLTVTGDGAVAMRGARGATLINDGVINLGTATDNQGRDMVAMQSDGSATLNNRRGGVINIHAADSFAFQIAAGGSGRLINNGVVNVYGQGSGMHADADSAAADRPGSDLGWQAPRGIRGYTVGTNADGSAGQLVLHDGGQLHDVTVDTGFTRGTDASHVVLHAVVSGAEGGEQNIRSASVVWHAQAERDERGNVDVTMQRRDYRELAGEDQQQIASALETAYRNDALFHSLELADQRAFQSALQQLSGASLVGSALRVASNADALWSQLAAQPAAQSRALAFGGGQANAFGVRGDGGAMQVAVQLRGGQVLQLATAALSGDLSAGSGQDRLQSQFAGIGLAQQWGALQLRHQLGHEQHQLQGQRQLSWGQTRESAHSQRRMARTMLATTLDMTSSLGKVHWQPRIKASAFDQHEGGFHEQHANGFGLAVAAGRLQGVQLEVGSAFQRALGTQWHLQADVAASRPLALREQARAAYLLGASGQAFTLPGVRHSGLDHRLQLGLNYQASNLGFGAQLASLRQWGERDVRAELQFGYRFR